MAEEREREHQAECEALHKQLAASFSGDSDAQVHIGKLSEELKSSQEAATSALEDVEQRLQAKCRECNDVRELCAAAEAKAVLLRSEHARLQTACYEVCSRLSGHQAEPL